MFRIMIAPLVMTCCAVAPALAAGPQFFYQPACSNGGLCKVFDSSFTSTTLRSYSFIVPGAGKALITFNASLQCENYNGSASASNGVVEFDGQIVQAASAVPFFNRDSGFRVATRIAPFGTSGSLSTPYGISTVLQATYAAGGQQTVYARIKNVRMDPSTTCTEWNAQFSVVFIPN